MSTVVQECFEVSVQNVESPLMRIFRPTDCSPLLRMIRAVSLSRLSFTCCNDRELVPGIDETVYEAEQPMASPDSMISRTGCNKVFISAFRDVHNCFSVPFR